jgi:Protein of unknown function (DUF2786)
MNDAHARLCSPLHKFDAGSVTNVVAEHEYDRTRQQIQSVTPLCKDLGMSSKSAKRLKARQANNQRDQQSNNRTAAEERAWQRWQNPEQQPFAHAATTTAQDAAADNVLLAQAANHVRAAGLAILNGDEQALMDAVEAIAMSRLSTGERAGSALMQVQLAECTTGMFERGWQPFDLIHVVQKQLDPEHRDLMMRTLTVEQVVSPRRFLHDRWVRQLDILNVPKHVPGVGLFTMPTRNSLVEEMRFINDLRVGVELFVFLRRLPILHMLIPPPSDKPHLERPANGAVTLDDKILSRVRGLLAKAESTTFEEEADALLSKAQELMARHAIDIAMLEASKPNNAAAAGAVARRVHIDDPYFDSKTILLSVVSQANHCRSVTDPTFGLVTVFGFDADQDIVELLFTSLLAQATSAMVAVGRSKDRNGTTRTKSFRRAFILAYATRIGERLEEAKAAATQSAQSELGDSFLPVLASRVERVDVAVNEMFPKLKQTSSRISNMDGWHAGRDAADQATIRASVPMKPGKS